MLRCRTRRALLIFSRKFTHLKLNMWKRWFMDNPYSIIHPIDLESTTEKDDIECLREMVDTSSSSGRPITPVFKNGKLYGLSLIAAGNVVFSLMTVRNPLVKSGQYIRKQHGYLSVKVPSWQRRRHILQSLIHPTRKSIIENIPLGLDQSCRSLHDI